MFLLKPPVAALVFSLPLIAACQMQSDKVVVEPIWVRLSDKDLPTARWDHLPEGKTWTRHAMSQFVGDSGRTPPDTMPEDIEKWCPDYSPMRAIYLDGTAEEVSTYQTIAFWVGFLSVMAENESSNNPRAVGGDGKRYGLLQISPATATENQCAVTTGEALKDPVANISCAVRIMTKAVLRDDVVAAGGRGVAADWAVLRSPRKRAAMQKWLSSQSYCQEETY